MKALEAFKSGDLEVLVATDVAARGLDVAGVPCVINYDLPFNAEDYVHRIGRTGRAGASGEAIALFTPDEEKFLLEIEKLIKAKVPRGTLSVPRPSRQRHGSQDRERRGAYRYEPAQAHPVDDFFFKPYEPSSTVAAEKTPSSSKPSAASNKRSVGVLLGGGRY